MTHIPMVPFGGRLTAGQLAVQATAAACPTAAAVSKWAVLRWISDARVKLGVSDRAVAVLHALLSFVKGEEVRAGEVVFPSNTTLSSRAHGMTAPTLRRHIGQLVDAGLIIRRDSPNGKRYARRSEDGVIALAFGFELTPLVARSAEIEAVAAAVAEERLAIRIARERVTLLRRDITGLLGYLIEQGIEVPDEGLPPVPPRGAPIEVVEEAAYSLGLFRARLDKHLAALGKSKKMSANDIQTERHIQDSNQTIFESEPLHERERVEPVRQTDEGQALMDRSPSAAANMAGREHPNGRAQSPTAGEGVQRPAARGEPPRIDLPAVLAACPSLKAWAPARVRTWEDLVRAAEQIRPALGISPDAWTDAVGAMGESGAAVTVVTILQRAEMISSPGGYLRSLSSKARVGAFSPAPIVVSLLRQRAKTG